MFDYSNQEYIEKEAREFWVSFVNEILYNNRFRPKHDILSFLKYYLNKHDTHLNSGTILYRARIIDYTSQDADKTGLLKWINHENFGNFEGYDEINSYVPSVNRATSGRANPDHIVYLYAAKEIITAIGEVRPKISDHISVAKIQLLKDIKLADFTYIKQSGDLSLEQAKIYQITKAFSTPYKNTTDYIPTQFIAEYVKTLGFDGIAFNSSFVPGGINYTIFYPNVAKAIASAPYKMDSIVYRARRIAPLKRLETFDIIATNEK